MYKILIAIILVGTISLFVVVYRTNNENYKRLVDTTQQDDIWLQHLVDDMNGMLFFRDENTDLCFAYAWRLGNGGPMMAHVPCAGLPLLPFWSDK